jgi:competence ComEA-like helix-hairpin-helix protein
VTTQKIYLNTASAKRLSAAPGINEDLAEAIVEYRKTCGFFKDPEDLLKVPGITQDTYNEIKPRMSPEGFIYCYPKKGVELEEEDEDAPAIAPTKPLC